MKNMGAWPSSKPCGLESPLNRHREDNALAVVLPVQGTMTESAVESIAATTLLSNCRSLNGQLIQSVATGAQAVRCKPMAGLNPLAEVERVNAQFARAEQIAQFRIIDRVLTPEDEEITPAMTLKRKFVQAKFAALISEMYAKS